ncbi:solute carrier family 35 member C2 isoform X3 [Tachyglossus aculeatus]|uniref:solute carrier family 35 member C2 isoform X3 n=1 Tax=Tachyglossus aculeatus TaxID=9261 RepID=UPI0018F760D1|nr:solute carrier family 35 member C2 isoform X3 [Tachyglossus aculeatus]
MAKRGSVPAFLGRALLTLGLVLFYYCFSIGITFYNKWLMKSFHFPLFMTLLHLAVIFASSALARAALGCLHARARVVLSWPVYLRRVAPTALATVLDVGLSNWSFLYITVSLYTMTKSSAVLFILMFSLIFRLEELVCPCRRRGSCSGRRGPEPWRGSWAPSWAGGCSPSASVSPSSSSCPAPPASPSPSRASSRKCARCCWRPTGWGTRSTSSTGWASPSAWRGSPCTSPSRPSPPKVPRAPGGRPKEPAPTRTWSCGCCGGPGARTTRTTTTTTTTTTRATGPPAAPDPPGAEGREC